MYTWKLKTDMEFLLRLVIYQSLPIALEVHLKKCSFHSTSIAETLLIDGAGEPPQKYHITGTMQ